VSNAVIAGYKGDRCQIDVKVDAAGPLVSFKGVINDVDPQVFMDPLFDKLHQHMVGKSNAQVVVDLTNLAFMNSCGIKAFIKWVTRQGKTADAYKVILRHARQVTWQETSLRAVAMLARNVVVLEGV
jgi:hypothetical protein